MLNDNFIGRGVLMDNKIVIEPAFKIREMARKALEGNWQKMYLGVFLYFFMLTGIMELLDFFFSTVRTIFLPTGQHINVAVGYASWLYEIAVRGALIYGLSMFMLAFLRKKVIDYGTIFDGFSVFGKTFVLYILYSIKVFLWSLLLVIPGIVATYRYSQAFYLQVDHADWSASQCINESKFVMTGNKGKLFYLNLTFIGWYLLASLPGTVILELEFGGIFGLVLWLIASLPVIIVDLYSIMSQTIFYELATGNLVVLRETRRGEF